MPEDWGREGGRLGGRSIEEERREGGQGDE